MFPILMMNPAEPHQEPPLYSLLMELTGWTLDRLEDIPKKARFTFGQQVDHLTRDALQAAGKYVVHALACPPSPFAPITLKREQRTNCNHLRPSAGEKGEEK